ncbi:MAG: 2-oxoglutarate oxidoreductase [Abditibacteriota bacterium]|nr:2-oxoglutarate oxidoreductase [Abditibacteriota bacterium]MBR4748855.1 2-oxoglutarate oxidoreductase [Abditibacteriota bacterium]
MEKVFSRTKGLKDKEFSYCGGCLHSVVHRLVAENLEEMGLLDSAIGVCPVGCAVFMYDFINCDMIEAAHGRAPAVATGVKRTHPDHLVFTYQGDGDLASIGMAEIVHAANRGENFTVIFINNGIYGMTGGQMAPTTLVGQKATTCQAGRDPSTHGMPIHMAEMLATLDLPCYIERVSPIDPAGVRKTKAAIKKAFQKQLDGKGFSLIEVLSNCPTQWGMTPVDSLTWVKEHVMEVYPLGVKKERD